MFIKRLRVENFKSFRELDIELGPLNVLVGANASGKSNLITVLSFLKNIITDGLENAISQEGGVYLLANGQIREKEPLKICINYSLSRESMLGTEENINIATNLQEITYEFSLQFDSKWQYRVLEDKLNLKYEFMLLDSVDSRNILKDLGIGDVTIFVDPQTGRVQRSAGHLPSEILTLYQSNDFPIFAMRQDMTRQGWDLLLNSPFQVLIFEFNILPSLQNIPIYDFDPVELKSPQSMTGRLVLEENGSNISLVLRKIIANSEQRRKLNNLISYLLPHIKDLHIQSTGNSLYFETEEIYLNNTYFPSSFLSPGTVNIIALIVALYFENKPIIVIEEPERNIHPGLISKLMQLFKEVAHNKQIILTTHNPQLVKHTDLECLYLVSRDKEGFSVVTKPGEKEEIQIFLENDLGLDDLYVQNLLEGWA